MQELKGPLDVPLDILPDDRFLCSIPEFIGWAQGRRTLRMENFYREMRGKTGLLMEGEEPAGGQWNYDHDNRASPDKHMDPPPAPKFEPDGVTQEVIEMVARRFDAHFGSLDHFGWPVTAAQAEAGAAAFVADRLPDFGTWQDAMVTGEDDLYHSLLSTSINLGLLDPVECCRRAEQAWADGKAPINAVEGFIRQIIGWREYIRGMYWLEMPELAEANALDAQSPPARILLDRRNRDALHGRGGAFDARECACAPYPAADGAGQFRADRRDETAGGRGLVPGGLCRRL